MVAALVEAATRLFAEHGPGDVSLRDVAREADVNLGLIHRYIGGKQSLLSEVLARRPGMPALGQEEQRSREEIVELVLTLIDADTAYTNILLRAILDGFEIPQLQVAFPVVRGSATAVRRHLPKRDADVRVAALTAMALGWQAVGAQMLEVLDEQNLTRSDVAEALRPALLAFLTAAPSS